MKTLTLDEIIEEVPRTGRAESDWGFLANAHFPTDAQNRLEAWAKENGLEWEAIDYDFGKGQKGQTIIFHEKRS